MDPPAFPCLWMSLTLCPFRTRCHAAASPAGPAPITETFLPVAGSFSGIQESSSSRSASPAARFNRQMETASSMDLRLQAPSQGAGQIRPKTEGSAISFFTTFRASANSPLAKSRFIRGISMWAGQVTWQGASQSPTCSLSKSSREVFLAWKTSSSLLIISIPSSTSSEQDGSSFPDFRSFTTQTMHEEKWGKSLR